MNRVGLSTFRNFGLASLLFTSLGCVGQVNESDATEGKSAATQVQPSNTPTLPNTPPATPPAAAPTPTYYVPSGQGGQGGQAAPGGQGGPSNPPAPAPTTAVDGGACAPATPTTPAPDAGAPPPTPTPTPTPTPDAGSGPVPTPVCATAAEIASKILTPKCGACHGKSAPAAGLDLVTTGVKARLLGVAARGCAGKTLIVATPTVGGHFFDKLYGAVGGCGNQMPFGAPPLSAAEIKCLSDWIAPTP
jgi:hypothetical protein